ncbi:MAG: uncharacterized protein A8A55_3369, partial [Amphiamblys sp. WSBS2006]
EIQEDSVLEELKLAAEKKEHVAGILAQGPKVSVGGTKKIILVDCAVAVLLKLEIQEDSVLEELILDAEKREHVAPILAQEQKIRIGGTKKIYLRARAMAVFPRLELHKNHTVCFLMLNTEKEEHILAAEVEWLRNNHVRERLRA